MKEKLYNLVESLGEGEHGTFQIADMTFRKDEWAYRVYHDDGYCFDVINSMGDDGLSYHFYDHYDGHSEGFSPLTVEKAIELLSKCD